MNNEIENPFSVTKATEFSDLEINEYWVNFNTEKDVSIVTLLNPNEYLPKYLIGGKGCGKTHILRYFSFPLQKIRNENNIQKILKNDKYIGFYSILGGLTSSRFKEKGIDDYQWYSIFEYYFELYICNNILATIKEIISSLDIHQSIEEKLILNIIKLFNNYEEIKVNLTFDGLIHFIENLRRKIDSQILNAAFTRKLEFEEVKVLFSPGELIFGIPNKIVDEIKIFEDVKFILIFDEYEKLFEWQKKFLNTLVWDKKTPVTFWIGARRYGYTTRETKSGQEMKSGSEFQPINLDDIIRKNEKLYKQFAEQLYLNRLAKYYETKNRKINPEELNARFCNKFEPMNEEKLIRDIIQRNNGKEYKHLKNLKKKLLQGIKFKLSLDITNENQIDSLIKEIKLYTNNNPLEQKYKIFLLYQLWFQANKNESFKNILKKVNIEYEKNIEGLNSDFKEIKDKRKKDFIAQLAKENDIINTEYSGIDKFIEISQGNARSFILLLKKSIEFAGIRGEKPMEEGGSISLESQYLSVYDTARWFYEDAELIGEVGKNTYRSLKNLTDYFVEERYCDKPVDTTISCFYIKAEELSTEALSYIDTMIMHSILIEDEEGRIEKNTKRKERLFQLNKTIAPLWNLPTVVRGSIFLSKEVAESIFNFNRHNYFDSLLKRRRDQLNAPNFRKKKYNNRSDLFSN